MSDEIQVATCPQCGGPIEQTRFGPLCPACLRRASREVKQEAKSGGPERCRGCGVELVEPVIIVDGYGPCCRLAPAPVMQATPAGGAGMIPAVPMPLQAFLIGVDALIIDAEQAATLDSQKIGAIKASVKLGGQALPVIVDGAEPTRVLRGAGIVLAARDLASGAPQFRSVWAVATASDTVLTAEYLVLTQREAITKVAGSELSFDAFAAQVADLLGIDFESAFQSLDMTELAPLGVALQDFRPEQMDVPEPDGMGRNGVTQVKRIRDRFFAVAPPPEPIRGPSRIVVNVTGELAAAVTEAIDAMRTQHDQANASDGDLLAIVCREWLAGRGRDVPKQRPEPDF